jgi:alpha-tubulin suppressor-like RCC1 family protein
MVQSGTWTSVGAGPYDVCAIDGSDALWCVGDDQFGQLGPATSQNIVTATKLTSGAGSWAEVSIGDNHLCALASDHTLWCEGADGSGQLGDGGGSPTKPTQVGSATSWMGVAAGFEQMCAFDVHGGVQCAGDDGTYALGSNDDLLHANFDGTVSVPAATAITVGDYLACATTGSGLYCWGDNLSGGVGGSSLHALLPSQISSLSWSSVSSYTHSCGIEQSELWCWGANEVSESGQAGSGSAVIGPTRVGSGTTWAAVAAGSAHTCALQTNGSVYCFGDNTYDQLSGTASIPTATPTLVQDLSAVTAIVAGQYHTCAIAAAGSAYCWGDGASGQLGNGGGANAKTPTVIDGHAWSQLAAGVGHTCGIASDTSLWCWGDNDRGELGNGTFTNESLPTQVGSETGWSHVTTGNNFTCATKTDGTLWCWGANDNGQLATGTGFRTSFVQVR